MTVAGRGHRPVSGSGLLAVGVLVLLAVCYLAGCGQRGPLTLPVPESEPEALPAAVPAARTEGEDEVAGQEDAPAPGDDETDERDSE